MRLPGYVAHADPAITAEERAHRFMLVLMALQRISYLAPAVVSCASPVYHHTSVNLALLAGTIGWNVFLFWRSARRGWFSPVLVAVDVGMAALQLVVVGANLPYHAGGAAANWADNMGQGTAALIGGAIDRVPLALVAVLVLVAAQASVTATHDAGTAGDSTMEMTHALAGLICFAFVVGFGVRYLRREGRLLDRLIAQRLATESARAAERAQYELRLAHHQALHDTVLTTLTVIARGAEHDGELIRQRCAHDADYIRRLLADEASVGLGTITGALHDVVGGAELLGLRVRYRSDALPDDLPRRTVEAFRDATREALNNVIKHAGVTEAWVTATWEDGELRVTVVDRGRGFDPDEPAPGYGLRASILDRLPAVGGQARISSGPDDGTCVELSCRG